MTGGTRWITSECISRQVASEPGAKVRRAVPAPSLTVPCAMAAIHVTMSSHNASACGKILPGTANGAAAGSTSHTLELGAVWTFAEATRTDKSLQGACLDAEPKGCPVQPFQGLQQPLQGPLHQRVILKAVQGDACSHAKKHSSHPTNEFSLHACISSSLSGDMRWVHRDCTKKFIVYQDLHCLQVISVCDCIQVAFGTCACAR